MWEFDKYYMAPVNGFTHPEDFYDYISPTSYI